MGSRAFCEKLGLDWASGSFVEMRGISARPECIVAGMIHPVELLGREGFFDAFRIEFDMRQHITAFTLVSDVG